MKAIQNVSTAAGSSGRIWTVTKRRSAFFVIYASCSRIWTLTKNFVIFALAMMCLAAAGSDGPYFPWPNIIGTVVFGIMAMIHLINRHKSDIMTRTEERIALNSARDLNARLGRMITSRSLSNKSFKERGASFS